MVGCFKDGNGYPALYNYLNIVLVNPVLTNCNELFKNNNLECNGQGNL